MATVGRVAADERGPRPTLDDIEIGKEFGPVDWMITDQEIDNCCMSHNDYHEWYSVGSPFGGRIAPPLISYSVVRETFKKVYRVRGLFVGWTSEQLDVIRPNTKYVWRGRLSDKYVRRDREWVWYEFVCADESGHEIIRTKRGHVLDYLTIDKPRNVVAVGGFADENTMNSNTTELSSYMPPLVKPKTAEDLKRVDGAPISTVAVCDRNTPLGSHILPMSQQVNLRYVQDRYELSTAFYMASQFRARNIHNDPEIAKQEGLEAPNMTAPQAAGTIARMMQAALGEGWVKGSKFELRFIKQNMIEDFLTAKGILVGKRFEGDKIRLEFDVWIENQRGVKTCVGRVSGPVPA